MIGLQQYSFSGMVSASARAGGRAAANMRRPLYAEQEEQPRELVQGGSRQAGELDRWWPRLCAPVDPCAHPAQGRRGRGCSQRSLLLARHQDRRCSGDKPLDGRSGAPKVRLGGVGGGTGPPQAQGHQTQQARRRAGGPSDRSGLLGASQGHKALALKGQWSIPPKQDGSFVWRMEDILEVYTRPYEERFPQVCLEEKSKQLVGEVREPLALCPGHPTRYDYEYERNGTANLFIVSEPLAGWRHISVTQRRTKIDWAHCIKELVDLHYPYAEKIVLVLDNLNTHTPAALYEAFAPSEARRLLERLEIHYTPKHGSWLNMAEIELSVLARQCLDRRIPDQQTLAEEVGAWEAERNAYESSIDWRFSTQEARIKLKHLYPEIVEPSNDPNPS